jgi:beta-N-acetylhexosaminidase
MSGQPAPAALGAPADLALGALMLAFDGLEVPPEMARRLATAPAAGVTLFRFSNVESAGQVRSLTDAIQAAGRARRPEQPSALPFLVAADQEAGQLLALGDGATPFAGNMALGAAGDLRLTERIARAIGIELRAVGVNVDYAPVCDLATNPLNPAVGIRSFGDEAGRVGEQVGAFVTGLQSAGVAAGLKHFPGLGEAVDDTHHRLAVVAADRETLGARELVPFRAGIAAGARVVMSAHLAVPGVTGDPDLPSTLAPQVMQQLLRDELGFDGISITDALDMRALAQGPNQVLDVIAALRAGVDLLLATPDPEARERIEGGLRHAVARGLLEPRHAAATAARLADLRAWLQGFDQPPVDVVGCAEHVALAAELATRALTLVRDDPGLLPLRLDPGSRVAAIMPVPTDQTPADTSSIVAPGLAPALRDRLGAVDEIIVAHAPQADEIAAVRDAVRGHDLVVVGTTAAHVEPAQAALVDAILGLAVPTVTVALRTPFDLAAYPRSRSHVSTYGILRPSMEALAAALVGETRFEGHLPAAIPGLHPAGHRFE